MEIAIFGQPVENGICDICSFLTNKRWLRWVSSGVKIDLHEAIKGLRISDVRLINIYHENIGPKDS